MCLNWIFIEIMDKIDKIPLLQIDLRNSSENFMVKFQNGVVNI
jgi:hypothetical protein